ncbi:MAG: hypothetical protein JHC40_02680 [Burkholderiales bacterium]|jgi:hypothetical protein|nr:hypothetical protein [Burkholderiales bacterium]
MAATRVLLCQREGRGIHIPFDRLTRLALKQQLNLACGQFKEPSGGHVVCRPCILARSITILVCIDFQKSEGGPTQTTVKAIPGIAATNSDFGSARIVVAVILTNVEVGEPGEPAFAGG